MDQDPRNERELDIAALERRCRELQLPVSMLYYPVDRLLRRLGINMRSPVTFGFPTHLAHAAVSMLVALILVEGLLVLFSNSDPLQPKQLMVLSIATVAIAATTWVRYRIIVRRRLQRTTR